MREIIHCQVGQCGNQIGSNFWESLCGEHGLDFDGQFHGDSDLQLDKINVYFNEAAGSSYVPRAVLADLDASTMDAVASGPLGQLFDPGNMVSSNSSAMKNFQVGFYEYGMNVMDSVLDSIRKEAEGCEKLEGFQIAHSIGGGTGSGTGSLLITKLREEYTSKLIETFTVFSSKKVSDCKVEPYNNVLAIDILIEFVDAVMVLDNEALLNIATNTLKLTDPTFRDLNNLIARSMSSATLSYRFPCELNASMRQLVSNLVPYERMHFLMNSLSPLTSSKIKDNR